MEASKRFSEAVCKELRNAIVEAGNNEVFAAATINPEGYVISLVIYARGHESAVPIQFDEAQKAHVLIHNHPSGNLTPSDADLSIASRAAERAQGFYIVNNDVTSVYVVVEPVKPRSQHKLDIETVASYLSAGGPLESISEHFEERPTQIDLMENIAKAFNMNAIGVFEAGTGVGKSYAYLIPSILWSLSNNERVVISTGTINLQQQLYEKDIPAAEKITGKSVKAVLMKGRQNYICKRRLAETLADNELFDDEEDGIKQIATWAETSLTGSKSELPFMPNESDWNRINSESDACMGMRCVYHEDCFVMKIRKESADANLLIVNHHLLFADIETRMSGLGYEDAAVLPPYTRVIFDEAHGIEDAATSFFSESVTRFRLVKQLNLLQRKKRGATAGIIYSLEALSTSNVDLGDITGMIAEVKSSMQFLEGAALDMMRDSTTWRLSDNTSSQASQVFVEMEKLHTAISQVVSVVRKLIESISEEDADSSAVWEAKTVLRRLDNICLLCHNFSQWDEKRDTVFWIEKKRLSRTQMSNRTMVSANAWGDNALWYVNFVQTPLDISTMMNTGVFEPLSTVVSTSATLRIGTSFNFWMNRSGVSRVEKDRLLCGEFKSPFPYEKNLLFAIPSDAPLPDSSSFQPFIESTIIKLIESAGGRTLVLFTSNESLRYACDAARLALTSLGITVLKQGEDDRFRLLETFKTDNTSVLFATDSFWEGVDVPGESLSQVIIVKLPFSVPSDPVFAARAEAIDKRGGSAFMELSVPDAVIKFRQGFGRLMRRSTDRGVVTVLDRRLTEKRYGSIFIESVPMSKRMFEPLESVLQGIERFLSQ